MSLLFLLEKIKRWNSYYIGVFGAKWGLTCCFFFWMVPLLESHGDKSRKGRVFLTVLFWCLFWRANQGISWQTWAVWSKFGACCSIEIGSKQPHVRNSGIESDYFCTTFLCRYDLIRLYHCRRFFEVTVIYVMSHIYISFLISSCYHSRLTKISSPISPRSHGSGRCHCKESDCPEADLSKEKAERHHRHACGASCPKPHEHGGDVDQNQDQSRLRPEHEVLNDSLRGSKLQLNTVEDEDEKGEADAKSEAAIVRAHIGRQAWWQAWRQPTWNPCMYNMYIDVYRLGYKGWKALSPMKIDSVGVPEAGRRTGKNSVVFIHMMVMRWPMQWHWHEEPLYS